MKKRKPSSEISAMSGENEQLKAKSGGVPLSIKATLNSAKKAPSISVKSGENDQLAAKDPKDNSHNSVKDPGHSGAYLERLKKRLNK